MIDRTHALRAAVVLLIAASSSTGCVSSNEAQADDCLRRLGLGFSAGYHAPVACPTQCCPQKLGVWHGWKQACTLPNNRALGGDCDCAPCAPAPCCQPAPCFQPAPCCGQGFGTGFGYGSGFGMRALPGINSGCPTCPGGLGQPGRAALMFN